MEKINVLVLFGGQSSEHDISNISASNVIKLLDKNKYDVTMVGITKLGQWFLYEGDLENIKDGSWENKSLKKAYLSPDTSVGLVIEENGKVTYKRVDVVFPVLHGVCGEDGTIQGLCRLSNTPCVGPDMLSSAICMDKTTTKIMFKHYGIDQADWLTVTKDELNDKESVIKKVEEKFAYPVFIKPANAGSSVGIGKSHNSEELIEHLLNAAEVDSKILVEEFIDGREIECAVLGNEEPLASVPGEIIPGKEFYDFEAKYKVESKLLIPALLTKENEDKLKEIAVKAYKALGLSGMSRVDFFVHKQTGKMYLNEINTIPGFTGISMYPMLMEKSGIEGTLLVDKLIEYAISAYIK